MLYFIFRLPSWQIFYFIGSGAIEFDEFVQILIAHPADEFGSHTEQHVSMTFDVRSIFTVRKSVLT